jgi:hypothetical protein
LKRRGGLSGLPLLLCGNQELEFNPAAGGGFFRENETNHKPEKMKPLGSEMPPVVVKWQRECLGMAD